MEPIDRQQAPSDDQLDRMLDSALAKYASAEPRVGLEERILAHLHAERPASRPAWLQWGLAGAVAIITVGSIMAWRSTRTPHPVIADHPRATTQQLSSQKTAPAIRVRANELASAKTTKRKPAERRVPASVAALPHPKLDQFPSPQPLSAEEIALAQYVRNFPKEARLVAQSQEEFALETEKQMNDAGAQSRSSGSIQQER